MAEIREAWRRETGFSQSIVRKMFNTYEHRDLYYIQTAEGKMDGQMNFVAIISRLTCPALPQAIEEFSETISLLFDIEEKEVSKFK